MKILFINKFFFLNGGVEKYLYDVMNYFAAQGHETIPFSVRYANSWPSPYTDFFMPPPGDPGQALWSGIRFSPFNIPRYLDRAVYSLEAKNKLDRLLTHTGGVDIAYVLNIYNYMSPSIIHTLRKWKIPVMMQVGDYNLVCPSYSLLREGRPCTRCVTGKYYWGIRHRCVKQSLAASMVRVGAMYLHRLMGIYDLVDAFVVPCEFMRQMLLEGGFKDSKLKFLPYPAERRRRKRRSAEDRTGEGRRQGEKPAVTSRMNVLQYPLEKNARTPAAIPPEDYILYFGRVTYEKGVDTLIQAFQKRELGVDLYIVGRGYDGEEERLKAMIDPAKASRIHFVGFKPAEEIGQWISGSLFTVVPSRWYDNAPISVYESLLYKTPVVAARIGGIPEQVQDGVTGLLFEPESVEDLAEKMAQMLADRQRLREMGEAGEDYIKENLLIMDQMERLEDLFTAVIRANRGR